MVRETTRVREKKSKTEAMRLMVTHHWKCQEKSAKRK